LLGRGEDRQLFDAPQGDGCRPLRDAGDLQLWRSGGGGDGQTEASDVVPVVAVELEGEGEPYAVLALIG
jgi:hypothetical protein